MGLKIAVVTQAPALRAEAAQAFDRAPLDWVVSLHEAPPEDADVLVCGPDVPLMPGAVAFSAGTAEGLVGKIQETVGRVRAAPQRIVVTGATGGCGVTSVALHLAQHLALDADTCVLDLDPHGSMAARLGAPMAARLGAPMAERDVSVDGALDAAERVRLAATPVPGGFRVLCSTGGAGEELMARAARSFQRVIADVPRARCSHAILERAEAAVLVVPPTAPGARRAGEVIAAAPDVPWAIVVNRSGPGGQTSTVALASLIGARVSLQLPCTPLLRDAEDDGRLITNPWCRWNRAVGRLAAALS
ncbi:MAG: hypothetical protein M3345_07755 [Actinomycetota bacterium]|nr:hypothetical protein [Actinomycetota bacterium]